MTSTYYPSRRPIETGSVYQSPLDGCKECTRFDGPSRWVSIMTPVLMGRLNKPYWRVVYIGLNRQWRFICCENDNSSTTNHLWLSTSSGRDWSAGCTMLNTCPTSWPRYHHVGSEWPFQHASTSNSNRVIQLPTIFTRTIQSDAKQSFRPHCYA